jgi:hypothetical protein
MKFDTIQQQQSDQIVQEHLFIFLDLVIKFSIVNFDSANLEDYCDSFVSKN